MFRAGIITASDKGAAGQREDLSGPAIRELLEATGEARRKNFQKAIDLELPPDGRL